MDRIQIKESNTTNNIPDKIRVSHTGSQNLLKNLITIEGEETKKVRKKDFTDTKPGELD